MAIRLTTTARAAADNGLKVLVHGPAGAGKSSILKLVGLLERPTRGTVTVNGQDTASLPARAIPAYRRRLGMVFQDHQLLMDRPVYDNVALPLVGATAPPMRTSPLAPPMEDLYVVTANSWPPYKMAW